MAENVRCFVGIDPGTTTGLAFVSLKGGVIETYSERHFSIDSVIENILNVGKPILVATDKSKVPSLVDEIATNLGCKVYSPDEDISVEKKDGLTQDYDYENSHEKDALAATLAAYNDYQNKFRNIESKMDNLNLTHLTPKIKETFVKDEASSVSEAIEMELSDGEEKSEEKELDTKETFSEEDLRDMVERQKERLHKEVKDRKSLEEYVSELRDKVSNLKSEKEKLEKKKERLEEEARRDLVRDEEIKKLKKKFRSKRNEVKKLSREKKSVEEDLNILKNYIRLKRDDKIPIRQCTIFNLDTFYELEELLELENDYIYVKDNVSTDDNFLDRLSSKVSGIIGNFNDEIVEKINEHDIEVIDPDEIDVKEMNNVKFFDREDLEDIDSFDKEGFMDWVKKYRRRD